MAITLAQLCDAVAATLGAAVGINSEQSFDELTSGMNTLPALQVYPDACTGTARGETDRQTFGKGRYERRYTIFADLYARQRSQLAEDMAKLVLLIDAVETVLDAQKSDIFGLSTGSNVAFSWSWQRATFDYAGPLYAGARFTLIFTIL